MAAAAAPAQAAPPAEEPPPFVPKPLPPPINDADYPEMYMPGYEEPPMEPPWEGWPEVEEPPEGWKPPPPLEDLLPLKESCNPHGLPKDVDMAYGPPLPWVTKPASPKKPPDLSQPVREYLMASIHKLVLEGLQLIVIERPDRPIPFLAKFLLSENPLACKVNCSRHKKSCHCTNFPPPPPPPPRPPPKKKTEETEEGAEG